MASCARSLVHGIMFTCLDIGELLSYQNLEFVNLKN